MSNSQPNFWKLAWQHLLCWSLAGFWVGIGGIASAQPAKEFPPAEKPVDQPLAAAVPAAQKVFQHPVVIRLHGEIDSLFEAYFFRKFEAAKSQGADLIVLDLDTGGGGLAESQKIAEALRDCKSAKTVAYIRRQALSGGTYISLGCDEIIMHPEARIGDVGVIFLDENFLYQYAPEKFASNLVQELRILSETKGRPPALAEAMVDRNCEVFRVKNRKTGAETFKSENELKASADAADWEQLELVLESQKGRFLTLAGNRAQAVQLTQGVEDSLEDCQARFQTAGKWRTLQADWVDRSVFFLNLWWVTLLLIVIGIGGLIHELTAPGTMIGLLIACLCFALFFGSRFFAGTSGWLEVLLFAAGITFIAMELFFIPGFGVTGVVGILLLVASVVLACQSFIVPHSGQELATLGQSLMLVVGSGVVVFVGGIFASRYLGRIPLLNGLVLAPPVAGESLVSKNSSASINKPETQPNLSLDLGQIGTAETALRPSGRARFESRLIDVISDGDLIDKGSQVKIVALDGHRVTVALCE